jgi:16S rRNA processing protein RimM
VTVKLITNVSQRLIPGSVFFVQESKSLTLKKALKYKSGYIMTFEELNNRNQAEELVGEKLYGGEIIDPQILFVHKLIGAEVFDQNSGFLGTIKSVVANPASDLIELETGKLIPLNFLISFTENTPSKAIVELPANLLKSQ